MTADDPLRHRPRPAIGMACLAGAVLLSGYAAPPLRPAPEKLQPWTTALRDQQPDRAFAAVYRIGSRRFVFVAAQHENQDDSATFQMVRAAYAAFTFDTVIAEGFPTSWGVNPARIMADTAHSRADASGIVEGGETVPTIVGALHQGAAIVGGEADDAEIKARIVAEGFPVDDLLGFYVLRNIPQWIGERQLSDAGDPRLGALAAAALTRNRERLRLPATALPGYAAWAAWYAGMNGKPIGMRFVTAEVGPLADGPFGTNKIAVAVSRARDEHLHRLIVSRLRLGQNVLVVFGGSHLLIQRPALDAVLGPPCYVGSDVARAAAVCR